MGRFSAITAVAAVATATASVAYAQTGDDVVVLVHGFGGSSGDWEYIPELQDAGLTTLAVDIGKFSSNWDRACEVYAQVKGTVVDYGVCHSAEDNHNRFGKDYTGQGLFPVWDANHRVNMIGHSLGGQTLILLERLLHEGSGCAQDTSPLFTGGGKNWIKSLTTISGTLDGTTLLDILGEGFSDFARDLLVFLAGILDTTPLGSLYDVDLSQWGLEKQPGENFLDFWNRAEASGILSVDNKDLSFYDMSEANARALNNLRPQTYPGTYYFAWATERTHEEQDCFLFWCGDVYQEPDLLMTSYLHFSGGIIGQSSQPVIKQKNDGLVPWINQICPSSDHYDKSACTPYTGTWAPSQWRYIDVPYLDHLQVVNRNSLNDLFNYGSSAKRLYVEHAARLKALPSTALTSVVAGEASDADSTFAYLAYMTKSPKQDSSSLTDKTGPAIGVFAFIVTGVMAVVVLTWQYIVHKRENKSEEGAEKDEEQADAEMSHIEHYDITESQVEAPEL